MRKTTLNELLHTARNTRNLIHPGVWANEGGKSTYESIYEIIDVTWEWLLHRVASSLEPKMHQEGILYGTSHWGSSANVLSPKTQR